MPAKRPDHPRTTTHHGITERLPRAGVKGWVVDQGKRLELGETWSEASIEVALKLAAVKFGRRPIRPTGSDEYRTAVLRVEKRLHTGLRFQDEARL